MTGLEVEQTANDLQIVFYTMVNLPQQHFLFFEGFLELFLCSLAVGDVPENA